MARLPRGQLRGRILDATARRLLATGNPDLVSIDDVVRDVGCTPPSLYYYFATKADLVFRTCRREYERFAEAIEAEVVGTPAGADRLTRRAAAYLRWAREHPSFYRVLFMTPLSLEVPEELADPTTAAGLRELIAELEALRQSGVIEYDEVLPVAIAFWAVVHGFASILVTEPAAPADAIHAGAHRALEALLDSYRVGR